MAEVLMGIAERQETYEAELFEKAVEAIEEAAAQLTVEERAELEATSMRKPVGSSDQGYRED